MDILLIFSFGYIALMIIDRIVQLFTKARRPSKFELVFLYLVFLGVMLITFLGIINYLDIKITTTQKSPVLNWNLDGNAWLFLIILISAVILADIIIFSRIRKKKREIREEDL